MIELCQVTKKYGPNLVLDIPTLKLEPGMYWLQGENGSGKSSFMRLLAGLTPFRGEASIQGVSIRTQPTRYRQLVHYAEAEPIYPPYLTGLDLIHFHQATRQASKADVDDLSQAFRIHDFARNPVGTYSSGMLKRLSLVLLFMGQPPVLLLDEPLVTLDVSSQATVLHHMREAVGRRQLIIFTSHQAPEAGALLPFQRLVIQDKSLCVA